MSVYGSRGKAFVPIKCVIPKTKKWNDPARLLPFSNSLIVCAGDFVGYEMAQIKNTEVLQLIVELDNIEYLAKPQADQASPLSPSMLQVHVYSSKILTSSFVRRNLLTRHRPNSCQIAISAQILPLDSGIPHTFFEGSRQEAAERYRSRGRGQPAWTTKRRE